MNVFNLGRNTTDVIVSHASYLHSSEQSVTVPWNKCHSNKMFWFQKLPKTNFTPPLVTIIFY